MTDDFGIIARDWITIIDDNDWLIYTSDGQTISVHRGDFGVEVHHVDPATGAVSEFDGTPFPYRAGAMEAVRRWLAKTGLQMVPSVEQGGNPWHGTSERGGSASAIKYDHSYRSKYDATKTITHTAVMPVDPLDVAAKLNAMLSGSSEPPPDDPTSVERGAGYHVDDNADPLDIAAQLNALLKGGT
jgi:hypothetical protein